MGAGKTGAVAHMGKQPKPLPRGAQQLLPTMALVLLSGNVPRHAVDDHVWGRRRLQVMGRLRSSLLGL